MSCYLFFCYLGCDAPGESMRSMTLYPSELMTLSTGMYTKHYYNGSARIASRIGGGFVPHRDLNDYSPVATADRVPLLQTSSYDHKADNLRNLWARAGECMGVSLEYAYSLESSGLYLNPTETADGERYFYHSDHLGSSAFITTENGYATQFLAYMPYGETLSEQQNSTSYYSPFKFSAKEKDSETGYSYFGARYYSPELSVWLSVDPLADHPNQIDKSPYSAFWNNPVIYNDPDGRCPDCPETSTANEGDIVNPNGMMNFMLVDGQWTGLGGTLNEVTVSPSSNIDAAGAVDASLGIIGGVFEVALGVAGEAPTAGISTALIVDGSYRVATNMIRLGAFLTENQDIANALPSNLGGTIGKFFDGLMGSGFSDVGRAQATLGLVNDAMLMVTPAANAGAVNSLITNPNVINTVGLGASYYSGTQGMINNSKAIKNANGN